jgi:hypothetical protein
MTVAMASIPGGDDARAPAVTLESMDTVLVCTGCFFGK